MGMVSFDESGPRYPRSLPFPARRSWRNWYPSVRPRSSASKSNMLRSERITISSAVLALEAWTPGPSRPPFSQSTLRRRTGSRAAHIAEAPQVPLPTPDDSPSPPRSAGGPPANHRKANPHAPHPLAPPGFPIATPPRGLPAPRARHCAQHNDRPSETARPAASENS